MAEMKDGSVHCLRKGFLQKADAEQHPVAANLWSRVWVEPIEDDPPLPPAILPPKPWGWVSELGGNKNGVPRCYVTDSSGRKICSVLGRRGESELIAAEIVRAVNESR